MGLGKLTVKSINEVVEVKTVPRNPPNTRLPYVIFEAWEVVHERQNGWRAENGHPVKHFYRVVSIPSPSGNSRERGYTYECSRKTDSLGKPVWEPIQSQSATNRLFRLMCSHLDTGPGMTAISKEMRADE